MPRGQLSTPAPRLLKPSYRMSSKCRHLDIRKFDGLRSCLACGEAVFENALSDSEPTTADAEQSPYQYTKLNYILGQEIRLLVILPGESHDPIRCEIVVVNLEDDPSYEALSYTWATETGDASFSETIYCGKGTIKITRNCHAALRRFRKRYAKRRLWVDAVCINQGYIVERNHQVSLMEVIYSRSSRVLVFIDSHTYNFKSLFEWLERSEEEEATPDHQDDAMRLLRLRWFQRVWVIQEVALAKTVRIFVRDAEMGLNANVVTKLQTIWELRPAMDAWPSPLRWTPEKRENLSVSSLLRATRGSLATDQRDKVYAIHSLLDPEYRKNVPIDYSLSQEWVLANLTVAIIIVDGTLDVLCSLGFRRFTKTHRWEGDDWPSWIPIYSETPPERIVQFQKDVFGSWNSKFSTHHLQAQQSENEPNPKRRKMSSAESSIEILPKEYSLRAGLKPILQLKAYYLDDITTGSWVRGLDARRYAKEYHTMIGTSKYYQDVFLPSTTSTQTYSIHRDTIMPFINEARKLYTTNTHQVFRTSHSLGFATFDTTHGVRIFNPDSVSERVVPGYIEEDFSAEVYAIDGARSPFILRSRAKNQYSIVTACYLMGALEYESLRREGTLGPWGPYPILPTNLERSRIIEIV